MIKSLLTILILFISTPAWATFTLDSAGSGPTITNGGFESEIGAEWTVDCGSTSRVTSPVYAGSYAAKSAYCSGSAKTYQQSISVTANTAYNIKVMARDDYSDKSSQIEVRTGSYGGGSPGCGGPGDAVG